MAEEIVCKAQTTIYSLIIWNLHQLEETLDQNRMQVLKKYQTSLLKYCNQLLEHNNDHITEEAYLTICDSLVIFSKNLINHNAGLKLLVVEPDKSLQTRLSSFLMDKVFLEDDDDEVDENIKIEELHKRRNYWACFCKLVVYNILNIKVAAPMFKHYMKLFKELQDEQGGSIDRSSDAFQSIKELARRFSLSFGLDQVQNREAVAAMHRDGILYSITNADPSDMSKPPPNIAFLEVLCEFTNKLMKQDKKTVLNYLDKQLSGVPPIQRNTDDWQALLTYRNSLVQGEHEIHPITLKQAAQKRYGKPSTLMAQWVRNQMQVGATQPFTHRHSEFHNTSLPCSNVDEWTRRAMPLNKARRLISRKLLRGTEPLEVLGG